MTHRGPFQPPPFCDSVNAFTKFGEASEYLLHCAAAAAVRSYSKHSPQNVLPVLPTGLLV